MEEARREPIVAQPGGGARTSPNVLNVGNDVVFFEGNEEAMYVLADLGEGCNEHLLKPGAKYTLKGLSTDSPELWLDGVKFEGQYEDFIGTLLMMSGQKLEEEETVVKGEEREEDQQQGNQAPAEDPVEHRPREGEGEPDENVVKMKYSYKCHTQTRIKFHKKTLGGPAAAPAQKVLEKEGVDPENEGELEEKSTGREGSEGDPPQATMDEDRMEIDTPLDPRVDLEEKEI